MRTASRTIKATAAALDSQTTVPAAVATAAAVVVTLHLDAGTATISELQSSTTVPADPSAATDSVILVDTSVPALAFDSGDADDA